MTRALAVFDGEHYAPVVRDALAELPYDFVGAYFAGGSEKVVGDEDYGVPVAADFGRALADMDARRTLGKSVVRVREDDGAAPTA